MERETSGTTRHPAVQPRLGVACLGRSTFAVEYAEQIAARAVTELTTATGWPVSGDATLLLDAPAARQAARRLNAATPDVLVIVCATFADASAAMELAKATQIPICLWAVREPGPTGDRLWLNSLCGANIASHALHREGFQVMYLYGDPGEPGLLAPLMSFARAAAVSHRLRRARIGVVGQAPTGFYAAQYDELALTRTVGAATFAVDLAAVFSAAAAAPTPAVAAVVRAAGDQAPSFTQLAPDSQTKFGQAYVALKDLLSANEADALAVRCWPEFPTEFGLMPCGTLGRLANEGYVMACEADVNGAVTALALQWLAGAAALEMDLVALDDASQSVALWHCGNAPACLARPGEEPILTTHCNRRIGVAGNFPLQAGPATIARLSVGHDGYRLFFAEGEFLDDAVNQFQGNTVHFRPQGSAQALLDAVFAHGIEHHVIFVHGHHASALTALAALWRIPAIHPGDAA